MVPLKVQTAFAFCVGKPGWNFSGIGCAGSMSELRLEATPGL
jgi:hypothetical protein